MPSSLSAVPTRALRFAQLAILSILVAFAAEARADIDLTGRWLVNVGGYAAVVQTGSNVTVTWTEGATNYDLSGTFDQTTLEASGSPSAGLTAKQYGGGTYLDGVVGSP